MGAAGDLTGARRRNRRLRTTHFLLMAAYLVAVTLATRVAPARRAARTDPMRVLRSE